MFLKITSRKKLSNNDHINLLKFILKSCLKCNLQDFLYGSIYNWLSFDILNIALNLVLLSNLVY